MGWRLRLSDKTVRTFAELPIYCKQQKCSPGNVVSDTISFMQIFAGVRWTGGVNGKWGSWKWHFCFIRSLSSEHFTFVSVSTYRVSLTRQCSNKILRLYWTWLITVARAGRLLYFARFFIFFNLMRNLWNGRKYFVLRQIWQNEGPHWEGVVCKFHGYPSRGFFRGSKKLSKKYAFSDLENFRPKRFIMGRLTSRVPLIITVARWKL